MVNTADDKENLLRVLEEISDPEIPVLSIVDLGIVRSAEIINGEPEVIITSTYNGCPAMDMITMQIRAALLSLGYANPVIKTSFSPAWTTDWISESGKAKMKAYGIAPPDKRIEIPEDGVECPRCHSSHTKLISAFGSTACKALYQCQDCKEPFDYFKCH